MLWVRVKPLIDVFFLVVPYAVFHAVINHIYHSCELGGLAATIALFSMVYLRYSLNKVTYHMGAGLRMRSILI